MASRSRPRRYRVTRRVFFASLSMAGGAILIACASTPAAPTTAPAPSATSAPAPAATTAPAPATPTAAAATPKPTAPAATAAPTTGAATTQVASAGKPGGQINVGWSRYPLSFNALEPRGAY